jgi:hypothetical protein
LDSYVRREFKRWSCMTFDHPLGAALSAWASAGGAAQTGGMIPKPDALAVLALGRGKVCVVLREPEFLLRPEA